MHHDEQLILFLLSALHAVGEIGAPAEVILQRARTAAWKMLTAPELETELRWLADKRWVQSYKPALTAERWRITALGVSALQEAGLA